jgi:hypothetical protein
MSTNALPTQSADFPGWYGEVVRRAGLAENSAVRGAMVIKPHGYAIWQAIQRALDDRINATGHENLYFPLFVPAAVPWRCGRRRTSAWHESQPLSLPTRRFRGTLAVARRLRALVGRCRLSLSDEAGAFLV